MNHYTEAFNGYWKECYNAAYYCLYSGKRPLGLTDSKRLRTTVHQEVWDNRFHSPMPYHGAYHWLNRLEAEHPAVGRQVRSRLSAFSGSGGVNAALVLGLLAAVILLLGVTVIALVLPVLWILALVTGLLSLAGITAIILCYIRSARALDVLKKAFDAEASQIRQLLERI